MISLIVLIQGPTRVLADEPLRVRVTIARAPYLVGQAIPLRVTVVAGGTRPEVVPPETVDAEIFATGLGFQPLASSGIGDLVVSTNRFDFHYRLVPRRSGTITVPPFQARLGDRSGRSSPFRLEVRPLPPGDRTAAFLGGVGMLEVTATARPERVRVGGVLEYRITLAGSAALGSTRRPKLGGLDGTGLRPNVEPLPDQVTADPPTRAFRWRLRPSRPAQATLPPVPIAYYDPEIRAFATKVAPGVPVRVVALPSFDPNRLGYEPPTEGISSLLLASLVGVCLLCAAAIGAAVWRRLRDRRRADPRRLARRLAKGLDPSGGPAVLGRRIVTAMIEWFHATVDRPHGALTPAEAESTTREATGDDLLAARARTLVEDCDRAQFAGPMASGEGLAAAARDWFEAIAARARRDR